MTSANTLRRLNKLWKERHTHDEDVATQSDLIIIREEIERQADASSGAGAPTLVVAASDSTQFSKDRADYICDGTDDHEQIQAAIDALSGSGGRILLCEGTFEFGDNVTFTGHVVWEGMGVDITDIQTDDDITFEDDVELRNLTIRPIPGG